MDRSELQAHVFEGLVQKFGKDEADRLSRYLLEDLLGIKLDLNEEEIALVNKAMERLISGEPLQYVTNVAHFYGYQYYVDAAALIPRPETEELVYQCLQYLKSESKQIPKILDIGTGSGCIPITIKKENSNCDITAYDISKDALRVAIHNANALGVQITFEDRNILSDRVPDPKVPFDIIISNPPYIPTSEESVMGGSVVSHEPHIALFTNDEHGLVFYQRIANLCSSWLAEDGVVLLELNEYHSLKIKEIYLKEGSFKSVEIIKDLQGKPRMLLVKR